MKIIGITGSIATGKSFVREFLQKQGIEVLDADKIVANIIAREPLKIAAHFPEILINGEVDKAKLRSIIFHDQKSKKLLETILHPLVDKKIDEFIKKSRYRRERIIAIEIALLFEKKYEHIFDEIWVCSCNKIIQEKRLYKRSNINREIFRAIAKNQMPDLKKRLNADKILHTGNASSTLKKQIIMLMHQ